MCDTRARPYFSNALEIDLQRNLHNTRRHFGAGYSTKIGHPVDHRRIRKLGMIEKIEGLCPEFHVCPLGDGRPLRDCKVEISLVRPSHDTSPGAAVIQSVSDRSGQTKGGLVKVCV